MFDAFYYFLPFRIDCDCAWLFVTYLRLGFCKKKNKKTWIICGFEPNNIDSYDEK